MLFLHSEGRQIVREDGRPVVLRGTCIGSWLNWESFMTGHVGTESSVRAALCNHLGFGRAQAFISSFLDNFITESDFAYLASLGVNVVRIAINYRHFEDDNAPGQYLDDGFRYLDRAVAWGKAHGIYTIIDLHAAQGWQNERWHSDNPHGKALLFTSADFRQRVANLWKHIAAHYVSEPAVAGYDLLNEPEAPSVDLLAETYAQIIAAIRSVDSRHILFLEGHDLGRDFFGLERLAQPNLGFSSHNYNSVTLNAGEYPGMLMGIPTDKRTLESMFEQRTRWLLKQQSPSWIGEFSTIFDGPVNKPTPSDTARLRALEDQLSIFNAHEQHFTIWSYKDIGYVGLVVSDPACEYMRRIRPIVELKNRLSLDCFISRRRGGVFAHTQNLIDELAVLVGSAFQDYSLDYAHLTKSLGEEAISATLSGFLSPLYARAFQDLSAEEIRQVLSDAFHFNTSVRRDRLEQVLKRAYCAS